MTKNCFPLISSSSFLPPSSLPLIPKFFFYLPTSGISSCVRTVWHGDVPPHLAQPCYVALGRALDLGLIRGLHTIPMLGSWSSATSIHKQYGVCYVRHPKLISIFILPTPGFKLGLPRPQTNEFNHSAMGPGLSQSFLSHQFYKK